MSDRVTSGAKRASQSLSRRARTRALNDERAAGDRLAAGIAGLKRQRLTRRDGGRVERRVDAGQHLDVGDLAVGADGEAQP